MGLGLWYGWVLDPVEYRDTDLSHLAPVYRDEYVLMVSETYALDRDLDAARARLALLGTAGGGSGLGGASDASALVADRAQAAIARGASQLDIQALTRLAAALGAERDELTPTLDGRDVAP
jgi:hypothetical protein